MKYLYVELRKDADRQAVVGALSAAGVAVERIEVTTAMERGRAFACRAIEDLWNFVSRAEECRFEVSGLVVAGDQHCRWEDLTDHQRSCFLSALVEWQDFRLPLDFDLANELSDVIESFEGIALGCDEHGEVHK